MESCNAASPGVLVLTTGLSKPFRRLDKYSGMLQELERHLEESHPDRGDTQRSVVVYKEIAVRKFISCVYYFQGIIVSFHENCDRVCCPVGNNSQDCLD